MDRDQGVDKWDPNSKKREVKVTPLFVFKRCVSLDLILSLFFLSIGALIPLSFSDVLRVYQ